MSAPCTLGSMSSDPHDEATRISMDNEWVGVVRVLHEPVARARQVGIGREDELGCKKYFL